MNYYEDLEVSPNASREVIESVYRVLLKKYQPNLQPFENRKEPEEKIRMITKAYETLIDEEKRIEYDIYFRKNNNKIELEKRLEEQVRFLQILLDAIPTPIFYKNKEGLYTGCNLSFEKYIGLSRQALLGKSVYDIFPINLAEKYHAMDMELFNKPGIQVYENKIKYVDGTEHDVIFNKSTFNDSDGSLAGIIGVIFDITDRKRIEKEIQKNSGLLCLFDERKKIQTLENLQFQTQIIINAINNLVIIYDKNNTIIMCNKAFEKIIEMDANDILGMDIQKLNETLQHSDKELSKKALNGNSSFTYEEVTLITPNGNKKNLLLQDTPIYNVDGDIIGAIGIGFDITLLEKEKQIQKQQEKLALLGQMAAGIVHEVKNPLTAILGFSQLISSNSKDDNIKAYSQAIESEAKALNKIVSDFLTFAKPLSPVFKELSLNEIAESMRLMLETNTFIKGIKINYQLAEIIKTVRADENQIKQVILNIVKNAIDAMKGINNPQLIISTGYNEITNESFLTICNNGKSMTEEEKKMIGTPFFTTKDKGTGLGLSICYQIIKEHGGRIEVESDIGTYFKLSFPVYNNTL